MNFDYSDDQKFLKNEARKFLEARCTSAAVRKVLTASQAYFFMPFGAGAGRAGIPDIVALKGGHMFGIECKAGKGQVTALQQRELDAIAAHGGTALVINETNINTLQEALNAQKET